MLRDLGRTVLDGLADAGESPLHDAQGLGRLLRSGAAAPCRLQNMPELPYSCTAINSSSHMFAAGCTWDTLRLLLDVLYAVLPAASHSLC